MAGPLTAERVFAAAANGDRVGQEVVAQEADRIAMTIAAVAAVLDPALVILGGGIGGERRAAARAGSRPGACACPRSGRRSRSRPCARRPRSTAPSRWPSRPRTHELFDRDRRRHEPFAHRASRTSRCRGSTTGSRPEEEAAMKRWAAVLTVIALIAVACSSGSEQLRSADGQPERIACAGDACRCGASGPPQPRRRSSTRSSTAFAAEVPVDHGRQQHRADRQEDHRRRSTPATPPDVGPVVRRRQRRPVLQHGCVDRHDPVHQRAGRRHRHDVDVPADGTDVHELQRRTSARCRSSPT